MTDRRQLIVVLPGIGGSVLARPGRPQDVVWDASKGDIAGAVFRPARLRSRRPRLCTTYHARSSRTMASNTGASSNGWS